MGAKLLGTQSSGLGGRVGAPIGVSTLTSYGARGAEHPLQHLITESHRTRIHCSSALLQSRCVANYVHLFPWDFVVIPGNSLMALLTVKHPIY